MFFSTLTAWIAVVLMALAALLFLAKRFGNQPMKRFLGRHHIRIGELGIAFCIIHGILAGESCGHLAFRRFFCGGFVFS